MKQIKFQSNSYLNVYDDGCYDVVLGYTGYYQCFPAVDGEYLCGAKGSVVGDGGSVTITLQDTRIQTCS